jgi:mycothiol system anti-sigma-R factor
MEPQKQSPDNLQEVNAKCKEMLQLIIDGEATEEQRLYFKEHMDECLPCFKGYELDAALKEVLKSKCCGGHAPHDLVDQIKSKIEQPKF